jgi:hypothetical protein
MPTTNKRKDAAIVEGYAHMWPREVFDAKGEAHIIANGLEFLARPGVYVLYKDEQPFYIGKAGRLRKRLRTHAIDPKDRYYHLWNFFSAFAIPERRYQGEIEGILIAAMPTANSASPKLPKERLPKVIRDLFRNMRRKRVDF